LFSLVLLIANRHLLCVFYLINFTFLILIADNIVGMGKLQAYIAYIASAIFQVSFQKIDIPRYAGLGQNAVRVYVADKDVSQSLLSTGLFVYSDY
jgi:hypothetical protein